MLRWLAWVPLVLGCHHDTAPDDGGSPTDGGGDTGDTGPTTPTHDTALPTTLAPVEATCDVTDNPQVFRCTVTLPVEGPATVVFSADGAPTRTFTDDPAALVHTVDAWGLLPDTTYDWLAEGVSGTATTRALPEVLAGAQIDVSGTLFGTDAVLIYVKCGYFVMVDSDGRIVWYLPTSLYDGFSDGMRWSQADRSVLAVTDSTMTFDQSEVGEADIEWNRLLHLTTADFDLDLTHDVDRWGAYTYLLGETPSGVGGFEVFDGSTKVGQWLLTDGFPTLDPKGAHVNGLSVADDGEVIVSSLGFSGAMSVDGDPASSTFLELLWNASGSPGIGPQLPDPEYVPASGTGFLNQHNVSLHGDELWVFDNRSESAARAVRFELDPGDGLLNELDAWSTGEHCTNQGGAQPVDGGALVTCANSDDVSEFRDGADTPDWTLHASCGAGSGGSSTRAYPVKVE